MTHSRVKKNTMKDFLDSYLSWLKEETLPGVWSKGVQASRNLKSIERISFSPDRKERRFKMLTSERPLAFEITLWIEDQDAHCNCGSKVEPCHHIVAAALAEANGTALAGATGSGDAPSSDSVPRVIYRWIYSPSAAAAKMQLRRILLQDGEEKPLPSSLVSWVAGVRSGRISGPPPSLTPTDLKIDELYVSGKPGWTEILPLLSDLPPIEVTGHPKWKTLEARARPERPALALIDHGTDMLRIEAIPEPEREPLQNGLWLRNGAIGAGMPIAPFEPRVIRKTEIAGFLLNELPALQESFEVRILARALPSRIEREPELRLKVDPLSGGFFSVTAIADYGDTGSGLLVRNPSAEARIAKLARERFHLILEEPKILPPSGLLELKSASKDSFRSIEVESALAGFLRNEIGGEIPGEPGRDRASVMDGLDPDILMKLLRNGEENPSNAPRVKSLLRALANPAPKNGPEGPDLVIPAGLESKLRDYQRKGCAWLQRAARTLGGAVLADDMGLGKTIQTLAILNGPSLVVVPASLIRNWVAEASRFRPGLRVKVYHGPDRTWLDDVKIPDLVVTTYSILRIEPERFSLIQWQTVVLDEAHIIRNPDTRAAIASTQLQADFRLALTGTPVQNRKRDLFSLFQFVAPGLFTSEDDLTRELTAPFFLRRTKAEVLPELPPKTRLEHGIELTPDERRLYDTVFAAARSEILSRIDSDPGASSANAPGLLEILLRARQACSHGALIDPVRRDDRSSKLARVLELVSELIEAGHSVLVYSQWTRFLDLLEERMRGAHPLFRLDGGTRDRGSVVEGFQSSGQPSVFLLSLHAGGVGLNLVRASHVVFCEPWWNPYVELQAEDRAYRMGQEMPVTIHRLIATNTIEEAIRTLQARKLELGEGALGPADFEILLKES